MTTGWLRLMIRKVRPRVTKKVHTERNETKKMPMRSRFGGADGRLYTVSSRIGSMLDGLQRMYGLKAQDDQQTSRKLQLPLVHLCSICKTTPVGSRSVKIAVMLVKIHWMPQCVNCPSVSRQGFSRAYACPGDQVGSVCAKEDQ